MQFAGIYKGTIPAASSPGINVKLTLNTDYTFELVSEYIDREGIFINTGRFKLDGDFITLNPRNGNSSPNYKLGDNQVYHLDIEGNIITGNLADLYILKKE